MAQWRTAFASVAGTSHAKTGAPCQDASGCLVVTAGKGLEVLIAAVSDGAGTASRSEAGASLVVDRFLRDFAEAVQAGLDVASCRRDFAEKWLESIREAIARLAEAEDGQMRDYACTLLGAVVGPSSSIYLQIGDGAIIVAGEERGEYNWIFWPQHGEYANVTNFITQENAVEALFFENGASVEEIALFSDGIERLVLDMSARTVHSPAFVPIFKWLATTQPVQDTKPSGPLQAYLSSDHVNKRTDDDKTLVMATRVTSAGLAV
jgi:hypothetical protein